MELVDKFLSRGRRTASRILEGKAFIILLPRNNKDKGMETFELGSKGTLVWRMIENDCRISSIVHKFQKRYSLEKGAAWDQVSGLIHGLRRDGLVEIKLKPSNAGKPWLK